MTLPARLSARRRRPARAEMSFLEHLDELRGVLISCLLVLVILSIGGWFASGPVLDYLVRHTVGQAQFIRPLEGFSTRVKLALLMGFIAGLPFLALRIWGFVVPGLLRHERRILIPLVSWSTALFLLGVAFASLGLTPTMLRIMLSFGSDVIQPQLAVGYLLDFFVKMAFACGLLFQLPLVVAVLSHFGIVTPQFLVAKWRHAVVIILIVAAVVTPGDGPSQLVLAVPIILLYFVSIFVSRAIHRGKRRRDADPPADGGGGEGGDAGDGGVGVGREGGGGRGVAGGRGVGEGQDVAGRQGVGEGKGAGGREDQGGDAGGGGALESGAWLPVPPVAAEPATRPAPPPSAVPGQPPSWPPSAAEDRGTDRGPADGRPATLHPPQQDYEI